jgi:hypothetical protein
MNDNIYQVNYSDIASKLTPHFIRNKDFEVKDGDFRTGNTNEQESYFILEARNGQYYFYPRIGFGINKYLAADIDKNEFRRKVRKNLEEDGFKVNKVFLVTKEDARLLNIQDAEILNIINQQGFILSLDIKR